MSSNNDDELFDMFMLGMFDDHSTPKRSGGGCAGVYRSYDMCADSA